MIFNTFFISVPPCNLPLTSSQLPDTIFREREDTLAFNTYFNTLILLCQSGLRRKVENDTIAQKSIKGVVKWERQSQAIT